MVIVIASVTLIITKSSTYKGRRYRLCVDSGIFEEGEESHGRRIEASGYNGFA